MRDRATWAAVAPFGAWIALMTLLPATAGAYALRSALAALALVAAVFVLRPSWRLSRGAVLWGLAGGLAVAVFWILPEDWAWYRKWVLWPIGEEPVAGKEPSPYDPAVCGTALTYAKLLGSAFVIAPVEELFFRGFLYRRLQARNWREVPVRRFDASAFLWMIGLFALEHPPRFAVAALCGAVYGWLTLRQGLGAAVLAHVITNLLLAIYVIQGGHWAFW